MEKIKDNLSNRNNILFNDNDFFEENKQERDFSRLNSRKKKLQILLMQKRYSGDYINLNANTNNYPNNSPNINKNKNIDINSLVINEEYKSEKKIQEILSQSNFDMIFSFVNEIYNTKNYQPDKLKYGLYLLNEKLLGDDVNVISNIGDLPKKHNFMDIIYKLLTFSRNEIDSKDSCDEKLLNITYKILINYSFHAKNDDNIFLFNDDFTNLHLYFLNFVSNESIINNILIFINNICLENEIANNKLFRYNNNKLIKILEELSSNALKNEEVKRLENITTLFITYINNITQDINYLNTSAIQEIFSICILLLNTNDQIVNDIIYIIGNIYKLLYKIKNFHILFDYISNSTDLIDYIINKDYSNCPEVIADTCRILQHIYKYYSETTDEKLKKYLIKIIDKNNNNIINLISYLFQKNYTNKIKSKLLNVLIAISECDKYYSSLLENLSDPFIFFIKSISSPDYKIRRKVLSTLAKLSAKHEMKINNNLMNHNIFNELKFVIDPSSSYCGDKEIIIYSLHIINDLFMWGEDYKDLGGNGGKNKAIYQFEFYGGKEMLEQFLTNKDKDIYVLAEYLLNKYYGNPIDID